MKKAIVYCRESRDDGGERYERIETQRDILLRFCKQKNLEPVHVIMDDNMSGKDFSRLKKVRFLIESENIGAFVAKDTSRIGRNQLESLEFIRFLELHGVELFLESEDYNEELFGLFAWLNERRAKEDGDKIRRVLKHKMQEGTLLIKPTYGYRIVEKRLVICETEADNVRFVFDAYLRECGMTEIARLLDKKFPSENWSCQKVSRILRNPIYCGVYQVGKTKRVGHIRKKIENGEEMITIQDHHQSIIPDQTFYEAEKRLRTRKRVAQYKYSGLLRCADCHSAMTHRQRNSGGAYYICSTYNHSGAMSCTSHKVYEKDLDGVISQALLKLFQVRGAFWRQNVQGKKLEEESGKKLRRLEQQLERLYEDSQMEGFPDFLFKKKLSEYNTKKQKIMEELKSAKGDEIQVPTEITVSKELLRCIADRIEVHADGKISIYKN